VHMLGLLADIVDVPAAVVHTPEEEAHTPALRALEQRA